MADEAPSLEKLLETVLLASEAGVSGDAFTAIYKWVGHLPGGLAMACTVGCAAFGAVCGNTTATSLALAGVALPEMRKRKYSDKFSLGCITSSGNIGVLIPPSSTFVVYGFLTETSIGELFMAGILPGILIMAIFCVQMYFQCRMDPTLGPPGPRYGWIERLKSIKGMTGIVVTFGVAIGGIYAGVFTPNEAASVGVFIVFLIGLVSRRLKWKPFLSALRETILINALIMLIIIGAQYFSSFLAVTQIPNLLAEFIASLSWNSYIIMGIILIVYVVLGFVMDIWAVFVITLPVLFPVVLMLGFDPLQFGVLCTLAIMIGGLTPPFGMQVFALAGVYRDVPAYTIFRGCMPFVLTMVVGLIILMFVPGFSTFLPDFMIPYR